MTTEIARAEKPPLTSDQIRGRWLPWLKDLSLQLRGGIAIDDRKKALAVIGSLGEPSERGWISARCLALLSHYYVAESDSRISQIVAKDWIQILAGLPEWAIDAACIEYLSGGNRHKKPLPGDIADLARQEIRFVERMRKRLLCDDEGSEAVDIGDKITPERRAEIGRNMRSLVDKLKIQEAERSAADMLEKQKKAEKMSDIRGRIPKKKINA